MRVAVALCMALLSIGSRAGDAVTLHIEREPQALQRALVEFARQRLESAGLAPDAQHARLNLSQNEELSGDVDVRATWSMDAGVPALPLTFELRPRAAAPGSPPVRATLALKLQRRVLVAGRRLRKGSQVSCEDFSATWRDVVHGLAPADCRDTPRSVALRDIAAGDVLRAGDVGPSPDVLSGAPVQVSASTGGITVTALATALADARVGDTLDVRLQRPERTLRARVTARGAAELLGESP